MATGGSWLDAPEATAGISVLVSRCQMCFSAACGVGCLIQWSDFELLLSQSQQCVSEEQTLQYEIVTEEMLSRSLASLNNLNNATSVLNNSDVPTWDSNASYNNEIYEETSFIENLNILNSTLDERKIEEDQTVPIQEPNQRPIRSSKPIDRFQAGL